MVSSPHGIPVQPIAFADSIAVFCLQWSSTPGSSAFSILALPNYSKECERITPAEARLECLRYTPSLKSSGRLFNAK